MASNFNLKGITPGTAARTAVLVLALANQVLATAGKPIIPIEDEDLNALITAGLTVGTALIAWWHNNSLTRHAQSADKYMETIRNNRKDATGHKPVISGSSATRRPPAAI